LFPSVRKCLKKDNVINWIENLGKNGGVGNGRQTESLAGVDPKIGA